MDLFFTVKGEYSDFTILGVCTEKELAEVLVAESEAYDARVAVVKANTALDLTTTSI